MTSSESQPTLADDNYHSIARFPFVCCRNRTLKYLCCWEGPPMSHRTQMGQRLAISAGACHWCITIGLESPAWSPQQLFVSRSHSRPIAFALLSSSHQYSYCSWILISVPNDSTSFDFNDQLVESFDLLMLFLYARAFLKRLGPYSAIFFLWLTFFALSYV